MDGSASDSGGTDAGDGGVSLDSGIECIGAPRAPASGDLVVNEIHADPDPTVGDANMSGMRSASDDEFIEIVNAATTPILLNGLRLADAQQLRHSFVDQTLTCREAIVIFGGGDPTHPNWRSSWVVASTGALGLNNTADQILIGTSTTSPLITVSYGSDADNEQSIVRMVELDPSSAFILHRAHPLGPGLFYSPGTRVDGSSF
jgi:hypothetical protein